MMYVLSQRNPQWANVNLGNTNQKVGRVGCTITSLSMLSSYFGAYKSPEQLAKGLKFTKNVPNTPDGLVYWNSMPKILPFKLEKRLYRRDDNMIKKSLEDPSRAVILQVDDYHWVVCLGVYKFAPSIYRIADPWTGKKAALVKPFSPYNRITGSAHLIRY